MSLLGIVLLALAATARIVVAPGALPQGARIEVVSLATGAVARQEVGIEEVALPAPEGEVVLSVFSPNGTARGFLKIAIKPGADLKVVDPPAPPRGHGQLSVELSLPGAAARGRKEVAVFLVTHEEGPARRLRRRGCVALLRFLARRTPGTDPSRRRIEAMDALEAPGVGDSGPRCGRPEWVGRAEADAHGAFPGK